MRSLVFVPYAFKGEESVSQSKHISKHKTTSIKKLWPARGLRGRLLQMIIVSGVIIFAMLAAAAMTNAKPGCPSKYGDVNSISI
jgi:hypothetical protein